jgi:DNA-binding MarR family transcriptional regulator
MSSTSSPAPDPLTVANRLRPVLVHLGRHLRREIDTLGVTSGQLSLLSTIRAEPGIGVSELAARERTSAPTMCAHIDRLEGAGLVSRTRGGGPDRRRVGLAVTEEGTRVLHAARSRRTAWLASRLRAAGDDELRILEAAIEPLSRLLEEAPATRGRAVEAAAP